MHRFRQSERSSSYLTTSKVGILSFVFTLYSVQALGCKCLPPNLVNAYTRSDFVAIVTFSKVTFDPNDGDYHDIEIETHRVFKGKAVTKMRANTSSSTSCAFSVSEGTTWLIFAWIGEDGKPTFGRCSGSVQIGREYEIFKHSIAAKDEEKGIGLKLVVLSFLQKNVSTNTNKYGITLTGTWVQPKPKEIQRFIKGFENKNRFAVYEFEINQDLSIGEIRAIQAFDNRELARKLAEHLRNNARAFSPTTQSIPEKTKLILVYFYYPTKGVHPSFVSFYDL